MNKREILKKLNDFNIDKDEVIILSTAALVLRGIKDTCQDIDIAVSKEYFDFLLKNYECQFDTSVCGFDVYLFDVFNFSVHYYDNFKGEIFKGFRIQRPEEVLSLKSNFNRDKDKKDILLIKNYLDKLNINCLVLAYYGDSIYEVYIRRYLISKGNFKVNLLGDMAKDYVSARSQSVFLDNMFSDNFLSDFELDIVKRARNHKSHRSKSTDIVSYKKSTGLEALIGFLGLNGDYERIGEIMGYIVGDRIC